LAIRVRRVSGSPVVAVRLLIRGGARLEEIPGQAVVTGRLLSEGTAQRDWRQIADLLEGRGMLLASSGSFEAHGLSFDALSRDWEEALDRVAELVLDSVFPEERCRWVSRQTAAELESLADQAEVLTSWAFLEQLYSPHPRSRPVQGDPEGLARLTPADCGVFHQRGLERGAVVSVAGDLVEEVVERRVRELFRDLDRPAATPQEPLRPEGLPETVRQVATRASDQAHLFVGQLTVPRTHADFTALEAAAVVLGSGSGLSGRIPARVREREGLAYSAHVQTASGAGLDPGRLVAYVGTSPTTVQRAEQSVREEIARLVEEGIEESELESARSYLLGREPFRRETARQWANLLAEAEFFDRPLDNLEWREGQLRSLDRAGVEAAVRRHIRPAELKVTVGLPGKRS
jgi:zinc protease